MSHPNKKSSLPNHSSQASKSCFSIITWREGLAPATFYVQSKGNRTGRPLKTPLANCWAVYSELDYLRGIAFSIYASGHLRTHLVGSVIPFMRIDDYRKTLTRAASIADHYDPKHLQTLEFLDQQIEHAATTLELFKQYQSVLAFKINRELNIIP